MAKMYHVKFNFIFDEENPICCEFDLEAENFFEAQFEAAKFIASYFEISSISEDSE